MEIGGGSAPFSLPPVWRRTVAVICVSVACTACPAAAGSDFPRRSLALGHPALHSEDVASGGVVESRVPDEQHVVAGDLLVSFSSHDRRLILERIRSQPELTVVGALPDLPAVLVRTASAARQRMATWLRELPGGVSTQPDAIERPAGTACPIVGGCVIPDDPGFSYQWYLLSGAGTIQPPGSGPPIYGADVDAPEAWLRTLGSSAVRVAVIDTGIDAANPDLAGKVVAAANFTASNSTQDLNGHGTHVAGTAAASFDNATGIAGMAPNARLMDIKVLAVDQSGQSLGDCADVADGVVWATDHGANVLNMSLGSPSPCTALDLAVQYAAAHGALVVAAAGNDGSTSRFYPAAFPGVLSVAATTNSDQLAGFSNRGASWVDVAAPGDGILSTLPTYNNATGSIGYGYLSGTSMAAPVVSGIAALIWGQMPAATAARDVEARIVATAQPITGSGVDFRFGRVDACGAVTGGLGSCSAPSAPAPSPAPPAVAPPQTAEPGPISVAPGPSQGYAAAGAYRGGLPRGAGTLRFVVRDSGMALTRVQGTVRVRCGRGGTLRLRIAALSTTDYGRIARDGSFRLRTGRVTATLRQPRIALGGRFKRASGAASGTLRVSGQSSGRKCDSRTIRWMLRRV